MATNNLKTIGNGIFGVSNSEQFGMLINNVTTQTSGNKDDIRNESSMVIGHLLTDDNVQISIDGTITDIDTLPDRGDVLDLVLLGVRIKSHVENELLDQAVVTDVTITQTNTSYASFKMSCVYYPGVDYSIQGIPDPPLPPPSLPTYYMTDYNNVIDVNMMTTPTVNLNYNTSTTNYVSYSETLSNVLVRWVQDANFNFRSHDINITMRNVQNISTNLMEFIPIVNPAGGDITLTLTMDQLDNIYSRIIQDPTGQYVNIGAITTVNIREARVQNLGNVFENLNKLTTVDLNSTDLISMNATFRGCSNMTYLPTYFPDLNSADNAFDGCVKISSGQIDAIINSIKTHTSGTHNIGFLGVTLTQTQIDNFAAKGWTVIK